MKNTKAMITLEPAGEEDLEDLKRKIQKAFGEAVVKKFGRQEEPIPNDKELDEAFSSKRLWDKLLDWRVREWTG